MWHVLSDSTMQFGTQHIFQSLSLILKGLESRIGKNSRAMRMVDPPGNDRTSDRTTGQLISHKSESEMVGAAIHTRTFMLRRPSNIDSLYASQHNLYYTLLVTNNADLGRWSVGVVLIHSPPLTDVSHLKEKNQGIPMTPPTSPTPAKTRETWVLCQLPLTITRWTISMSRSSPVTMIKSNLAGCKSTKVKLIMGIS